ncbi:glucose-6-phosphate isomerase [Achromobacter xylosoxidans]|uniref:glucose-6-phosphate isomerase n=1 Tax=Alcaligenes xylosoxydans xylosoxydans TaxID=85698 RepID=UPI0006C12508|nr:glucose-6-phosphate isomerase [Achromobacter xylosoxidans]MCH1984651.1 glucose-6-phosphate isomerase [Achromobacter xylosoxidans]MCH1993728.1 glucose-6-phosphate isomerase [Achromobacter xylosoxidans]MCH4578256.1 glucose-6-phosphate isomerase [Achromobacter xylosoxidans]MCH4587901.1 glucose-6-phosphate isomerase [Achromobacter xylosoxidans]QKI74959.1 glucose-6-phosphate isomerase [Achromobacter xylosoxidans]
MSLSNSPAWRGFAAAAKATSLDGSKLRLIDAPGLRLDLSAQAHSPALQDAAKALLEQQDFEAARARLFDGGDANWTERRPAWHTALRATHPPAMVASLVNAERERVRQFVRDADLAQRYSCVLHLGIGGSDWGPRLVTRALRYGLAKREVRFASNVDSHSIADAMSRLDPHNTLVIVASKSFTTTEPLANAEVAMNWLREAGVADPIKQVVAITANVEAALNLGISPDHIFQIWDWVGGRYSLWSAIGLPVALALGNDTFDQLLAGAAAMDEHFRQAPMAENAPLQLALAGVVNRSVLGFDSLVISPYDSRLYHIVPWAQQLEMESLGKVATADGSPVGVPTGPAVWGMSGTDCQHTFFQWLHQDTAGAPVDFILCEQPDHAYARHHELLIANCLAQRAALLRGKSFDEALAETSQVESDPARARLLAQHKVHPGGRPSSLIVLPRLEAYTLGALLALYEHKVFTQGVIWGINPFDQWGVEFGKALAKNIIHELDAPAQQAAPQDPSTRFWIDAIARRH